MKASGIFIVPILLGFYACTTNPAASPNNDTAAPGAESTAALQPAEEPPAVSQADSIRLRHEADSLLLLTQNDTLPDSLKSGLFAEACANYRKIRASQAWHDAILDYCRHLRFLDETDSIVAVLNRAIQQTWWPDDGLKGHLYWMQGYILRNSDRNYAAQYYLEKAKMLSDQYGNVTDENPAGGIYKTLGSVKTRLGDYEPALKIFSEALLLLDADKIPSRQMENQITRSELYAEMGIAYQSEANLEKALEHYQKALAVLDGIRPIPKGQDLKWWNNTRGNILTNIAEINLELQAVPAAEKAIGTAIKTLNPDKFNYVFNAYNTLAEVYVATHRDSLAKLAWQHALAIGRKGRVEKRELSKLLNRIGWDAFEKSEYGTAIQYAQKALHELYPTIDSTDYHQNPNSTVIDPSPENTVAEALDLKGEALYQLHKTDSKQPYLILADSTTALAIEMMENLRNVVEYESSKLRSSGDSRRLFGRMMRILYAEKESGLADATARAFNYAEKSRAVLLRQKLATDAALLEANKTDTLLAEERDLKDQWVRLRTDLFERQMDLDSSQVKKEDSITQKINRRIFKIEGRLRDLHEQIVVKYKLSADEHENRTADAVAVQKNLLRSNESWIEYFTDPDSNLVYLFVIDENAIQFLRQPYQEPDIRAFIEMINNEALAENHAGEPAVWGEFIRRNRSLYQTLLQPAFAKNIPRRLTLVPDGALALLPFDVLLYKPITADSNQAKYDSLPYLVNRCQLRLVPSATLELWYKNKPQARSTTTYAGFAPDYSNSPLRQVKSGAQVVQDAASAFRGKAFVGSSASLDTFWQQAPGCAIIHFHGHAEASDSIPDYSWMAFSARQPIASSEAKAGEANTLGSSDQPLSGNMANCLLAYQVYNSHLNAALVLLSACQTGLGKIAPGEGTLSLSRAFQAAGCPATVMSLWEVRDDATAQIMQLFLKNIRQGQDKDEALAKAKRDYIRKYHREFPYYWAGYVLTGTADPVDLPWSVWEHPVLLAAIGLLFTLALFYLLRQRRRGTRKPD